MNDSDGCANDAGMHVIPRQSSGDYFLLFIMRF